MTITFSNKRMSKTTESIDLSENLGLGTTNKGRKKRMKWLAILILILMAVAIFMLLRNSNSVRDVQYNTQKASIGDLTIFVTATGTLEPTNQVDVGSELSGVIESVGADYNDKVVTGQVLATLNTDVLKALVLKSQASLKSAQAQVLQTDATLIKAEHELKRAKSLLQNQYISLQDFDTLQSAYDQANAAHEIAVAQVENAKASLEVNQTDLQKAVIHSPIDGVVLTRSVELGQTVAASFQAPVLFTLAEDLTQMELHVDVDEADVGQVKNGQLASFYVDAYPERSYPATITQVRYGSQTVDGVVTYETVLNVDNADLSLRPGMTATADIVVKQVNDALLVPNAALRFTPSTNLKIQSENSGGFISNLIPRPPHSKKSQISNDLDNKAKQKVWVLRNGEPQGIAVTVGLTNGIVSEILQTDSRAGIEAGQELLTETVSKSK